jgi:hypothetical protein
MTVLEKQKIKIVPPPRPYLYVFFIFPLAAIALDAAKAVKAYLPLGSSAHQLYGLLCEHGYAGRDFSVVYEYLYNPPNPPNPPNN